MSLNLLWQNFNKKPNCFFSSGVLVWQERAQQENEGWVLQQLTSEQRTSKLLRDTNRKNQHSRCFSNSARRVQHRGQARKCVYSVRKIRCYFIPFEHWKSAKSAPPKLWRWFDNRIRSKLSKPLVLVWLNSEITWWNYFLPSLCLWDHRLSLPLHSHHYH